MGNEGNDEVRFALRVGEGGDFGFIRESWRRSHGCAPTTRCPGGVSEYVRTQNQAIATALATSDVLVAYPEAPERAPSLVMGWICYRGKVVHYVYVKPAYRRAGIGRALLDAALVETPTEVWTSTDVRRPADGRGEGVRAVLERARSLGVHLEYNPALIFGGP